MPSSSSHSSSTARPRGRAFSPAPSSETSQNRIPVTPAVLRSIFASSRTASEERSISRVAFFRFAGFLLSCIGIGFAAARSRGIKSAAGLGLSMVR
ncbi:hypothetical protein BOTBODRAFT_187265 [Botryobasidium botryosum FD-172 SS1]|uniref:Uncharacterized protein n=1 Tax=Botryobasidium botryosum (strain FD-172 SS1) TaxID=930990 RepID=A0A067MI33_BOTB1|nr:hypothetical protein BOTBODRAFT_187265 [Botryobasidium botryosum FD-172 SS1]